MSTHQEFWKRRFPRRVELVALPFDRRRGPVPSFLRDSVELVMPVSAAQDLAELSVRLDIPQLAVVLATVHTVLFRYTGQEIGTVGACADEPDSSDGQLPAGSALLPIQVDWSSSADSSGETLSRALAQSLAEANTHADYPLRDLQAWAGAQDAAFGPRLFNVAVRLASDSGTDASDEMPRRHDMDLSEFLVPCDIVVTVTPTPAQLSLRGEFDADVFEPATVERFLSHVGMILSGVIATPSAPVLRLPLTTLSERHRLIVERHVGGAQFTPTHTLHSLFETQVERTPDRPALTCDGTTLSYRELNERANCLARRLVESGVGPGTLVGLCIDRSNSLVIALLAILKAGGAYLPIDLAYPAERLAFMLEDAQAPVLLTETKLAARLPMTRATILVVDEAMARPAQDSDVTNLPSRGGPQSLAYVIYTSGTTGKPKGALITHANVIRLFDATRDIFGFNERDIWTLFHSVAFDFSVWEIWGALLSGGRVVVVPFLVSRSPEAFYELLVAEGVTVLNQTPSAFQQLIQAEELVGPKALALRYVIFGGEALEMRSLTPWFDRHGDECPSLVNMYGITETTVHVTYRRLSKDDLQSGSVIGTPISDLQVYILDQHRDVVPIGVAGEMYVGGGGLSPGYLNRPELTAERFVPDHLSGQPGARLYKTGDLARFLAGGDIEYLGRIDQQVKIRGFRIELGEIESVICQLPGVREAVVLAREDEPGAKRLVAYVRSSPSAVDVSTLREHLLRKVPDYMVPSAFVLLEAFPLTASGKIDRKALPVPAYDRPALNDRYVAPRTPAEEALAAIWSKALRVERIGARDNFFELGGDSILGIQITSLARREGIMITPQLLFANQTIAALAAAATFTRESSRPQETVSGDIALTPIQHWFFEQNLEQLEHYNQAFLFEVAQPMDRPCLQQAIMEVSRHHDSLCLRFTPKDGSWRQCYSTSESTTEVEWVDLTDLTDAEQRRSVETTAASMEASLDIERGPLFRVVHFDLGPGQPGRLLIVVHHLAVDGVSWRLLLEDLEAAYGHLKQGRTVELSSKTTSFGAWAQRLDRYSRSEAIRRELPYWTDVTDPESVEALCEPRSKNTAGNNTEGSCQTVRVTLSASETETLLHHVPAAYNTQINDVLLTALTRAWSRWSGRPVLFANLEGHGRELLFEDLDLSRTVGWFTSIFPVRLTLPTSPDRWKPGEALKAIKEQLRQVPHHGIGYGILRYLVPESGLLSRPEPSIVFNYLGQVDQIVTDSKLFRFAVESSGPWHSPRQKRRHRLELNSLVIGGCFELQLTYSESLHARVAVEDFAGEFMGALRALMAHCLEPGAGGRTPSDFPLAHVDQPTLDSLVAGHRDVEDIYPLSPIQTLFHSVNPGPVLTAFDQWQCTLGGDLNVDAFQRAWQETLRRHAILRSTIHNQGLSEPMQVVHRDVDPAWSIEDWRDTRDEDRLARWNAFLKSDRTTPLLLTDTPVMRFALRRLATSQWKFLWSVPAILLDGWSWPLVFRDASRLYEGFSERQILRLEPARQYRDYIEWLRERHFEASRDFWKTTLAGFHRPTSVVNEQVDEATSEGRYEAREAQLSPDVTDALRAVARSLHLTSSTIVQCAWAILLGRHSGSRDVVFGAAFAGRPTELHGSESIVGPLVNNVPVRFAVDLALSTRDFLRASHAKLLDISAHQFLPLIEIQRSSEVPWRDRIFDSIVVFQNYLVDESARRFGGRVDVTDFVGPIHSNYPVMLLAEPGPSLRVTLIFDRQRVPRATAERWGRDLVLILTQLPAILDTPLGELHTLLSSPASVSPRRRFLADSQNYVPPQTEMEKKIAGVLRKLLGQDRVGVEENFFDLGGHSLLVVQIHSELRESLKMAFPLVALFEYPTIRSLARHLDDPAVPAMAAGDQWRERAARHKQALSQMRTKKGSK